MRQLLLPLSLACLVLTVVSCSSKDEPPPEVTPIKNHLDKANAAADAANQAAARTDRLSAATDGTQDEEETEDDNP